MTTGRKPLRILIGGTAFLVLSFAATVLVPVSRTCRLVPETLPADGSSSARLSWSVNNIYGNPVPFYPAATRVVLGPGAGRVRMIGHSSRISGPAVLETGLRAGREPGEVQLTVEDGDNSRKFTLNLIATDGDRDHDGFPDAVELVDRSDREAFLDWFAAIAEAQFYAPDARWDRVHQDCAGLARFAYKQALSRHDRAWLEKTPYLHHPAYEEVKRYNYPEVPVLGERVFRTAAGAYHANDDVGRDFSASASAQVLWEHNLVFVSKETNRAQRGDLLFFFDPRRPDEPMHSMILIDRPELVADPRVVYHTGGDPGREGEVRIVSLSDLRSHSDDRWHVRPDNPYFKGFYRWKILEGGRS